MLLQHHMYIFVCSCKRIKIVTLICNVSDQEFRICLLIGGSKLRMTWHASPPPQPQARAIRPCFAPVDVLTILIFNLFYTFDTSIHLNTIIVQNSSTYYCLRQASKWLLTFWCRWFLNTSSKSHYSSTWDGVVTRMDQAREFPKVHIKREGQISQAVISTLRFIPWGDKVPRVLIHLPSFIFPKQELLPQACSMTMIALFGGTAMGTLMVSHKLECEFLL